MEKTGELDVLKIIITRHALMRFQERWAKVDKNSVLKRPERTIKKLLADVREIKKKPVPNVRALIRYKVGAKYFEKDGWVFVTNEEATTLLTVERLNDSLDMWEINSEKNKKRKRRD